MKLLGERRKRLGITVSQLSKLSGVPTATVNRILSNPGKVRFGSVAAVAQVLGVDLLRLKETPVEDVLQERIEKKARFVASMVQATQGLEAASLDSAGYQQLVEVSSKMLQGRIPAIWDEE